jgi:hypothetical protein
MYCAACMYTGVIFFDYQTSIILCLYLIYYTREHAPDSDPRTAMLPIYQYQYQLRIGIMPMTMTDDPLSHYLPLTSMDGIR